jgi:hypothetical protein
MSGDCPRGRPAPTTENIRINFVTPIPAASVHSGMNAAGYPVSVEKAQ